jgi:carboxylesterase type B
MHLTATSTGGTKPVISHFLRFFALLLLKVRTAIREPLVTIPKHFQNIRFAHDTSGAQRFASPVPFSPPLDTEIDASLPGAACPQRQAAMPPFFYETKDMSEDCLNLRIA